MKTFVIVKHDFPAREIVIASLSVPESKGSYGWSFMLEECKKRKLDIPTHSVDTWPMLTGPPRKEIPDTSNVEDLECEYKNSEQYRDSFK